VAHPRTRIRIARLLVVTLVFAGLALPALARPAVNQALVVVSPSTANAGTTNFSVAITNNSSTTQLGSVDLTVPADFQVQSFSSTAGTIQMTGNVVQLRSLGLPLGGSVTVTVDATVPCLDGTRTWGFVGKQSSNFTGASNFGFAAGSNVITHLPGACDFSLAFITQPADTTVGTSISGTAFNETATPVEVGLVDDGGDVVPTASATIELAIGANPSGGVLSGPTSGETVDGVASFPGISIDATGLDYTLVASSETLDPVESTPFLIADDGVVCSGSTCTATATAGNTTASVAATGLTAADSLFVILDVETLDCANYVEVSSVVTFGSTGNKKKRITITVANPPPRDGSFEVCYESPTAFTDKDGNVVTIGLLSGCGAVNKVPPCITQKTTTLDSVTISFTAPAGDPKGRV
jgi:hypothetical protein